MNSTATSARRPIAVVTGASSGIGFELAKQFAQNGYDLIVAAEDNGISAAASALEGLGGTVNAVRVDLAAPGGVDELIAVIRSGAIPDAVAINAGIGVGGAFQTTDLATEERLIDLNCKSSVSLAKHVVPMMTQRGSGRILFTASIAALMPSPFEAVYGASKAFVHSFALALRNELKDTGVSVTALMPGPTETNFFHRADMDDTPVGGDQKDEAALVAKQGFDALMAGHDEVIAGSLKTKVQAAVIRPLPNMVKAEVHRGMFEPDPAKH